MRFKVDGKTYTVKQDFHTHTVYSGLRHGKGTIESSVLSAREKGMTTLGITDHGPGHVFFGIKKSHVPKMREEVDRLNAKYTDIEILLGVEANIINKSGILDVKPKEFSLYDYVIAGYHYGVLGRNIPGSLINHGHNILASKKKQKNLSLMKRNTAYITAALRQNDIKILTHPGDKAEVDILEIAVVCNETDTLAEINTWHSSLTVNDLKTMALTDCKFVLSSDAHSPNRVGDVESGIRLALHAGLELSRIVNLEVES